MKIGFDAKRLFNNFTGLGNYSRFVVQSLLDYAPGNSYILYTPRVRDHPEITSITSRKEVSVVTPSPVYTFFRLASLWRTWGIARESSVNSLNVFHGLSQELPSNLPHGILKVVTVHDLIYYRFPMLYNPLDVAIYKTKVKAACTSADRIIAISRQTADDIVHFLGIPEAKIKVVYQGCHPQFRDVRTATEVSDIRKKYNLPDQYILNVGTIEARKNIILAVRALGLLPPASRKSLVIMGRETDYKKEVIAAARVAGVMDSIIFLHRVPFIDFPSIYQGAKLFVYPSLFEGFGIPLVEAIASGVPVITSTGSCFTEAAGPDSIYVDPGDIEEMALQLNRVLSDDSLRQRMIAASHKFIERFLPQNITPDLISIYKGL